MKKSLVSMDEMMFNVKHDWASGDGAALSQNSEGKTQDDEKLDNGDRCGDQAPAAPQGRVWQSCG